MRLTLFQDARIDSVTIRDFRIPKLDAGDLFTEPFTERETQRQSMVNKENMKPPVTMTNTPFLRTCAETAYYDKKTSPKNMILLHIHLSCAGSQFLPENQLGHAEQFPVCQPCHSHFRRPHCMGLTPSQNREETRSRGLRRGACSRKEQAPSIRV